MRVISSHFPPPEITTLIVDKHHSVGELITVFLHREARCTVVAEASSGAEALSVFRRFAPELVIAEVELADMDGIEMLQEMRVINPYCLLLIYTGSNNDFVLERTLELRPNGFVHKSEDLITLANAIRYLLTGGTYYCPRITKFIQGSGHRTKEGTLTLQEYRILKLIANGANTKKIGKYLSLSPKTIDYHRGRLMAKLGLTDLASLIKYALRTGLVAQD